jgi:hypothetical protein
VIVDAVWCFAVQGDGLAALLDSEVLEVGSGSEFAFELTGSVFEHRVPEKEVTPTG